jgi:hypothetical protein
MKPVVLLLLLALLPGCAEYQVMIAEYGAQAADDSLSAASWTHCQAATAASLERKYHLYSNPNTPLAMAWRELCYGNDEPVLEESVTGSAR